MSEAASQAAMSTSSSASGFRSFEPLSVRRPTAASASFCVYGSSRSCLTLCKEIVRPRAPSCLHGPKNAPALVWLPAAVTNQAGLSVVPFGAFHAVVTSEPGEVLSGLGVLVLGEVFRGEKVGLDLVDVSAFAG